MSDRIHMSRNHAETVRVKILSRGEKRQAFLMRKLEPQWSSRDKVKVRMGVEKWKKNPNPKRDFAALRREMEKELMSLMQAMHTLQDLGFYGVKGRGI
jgi:hypothetical protein